MTRPATTPSHILDLLKGDAPLGAVEVTAFGQTVVHQDGNQEVMLGFSPTEHIVRVAVHKDDLSTVITEAVDDYVIYGFCPDHHELSLAIEPMDPEGVGHLKDALTSAAEGLAGQGHKPTA